jgi:hypothetical protein
MMIFQYPKYSRIIVIISGEDRKFECDCKQLGHCADVELVIGDCARRNSVISLGCL